MNINDTTRRNLLERENRKLWEEEGEELVEQRFSIFHKRGS